MCNESRRFCVQFKIEKPRAYKKILGTCWPVFRKNSPCAIIRNVAIIEQNGSENKVAEARALIDIWRRTYWQFLFQKGWQRAARRYTVTLLGFSKLTCPSNETRRPYDRRWRPWHLIWSRFLSTDSGVPWSSLQFLISFQQRVEALRGRQAYDMTYGPVPL